MKIQIEPERLFKAAVGLIFALGIAYLVTRFLALYVVEHPDLLRVLDLFNLDREVSIPTWFSQMLLLFQLHCESAHFAPMQGDRSPRSPALVFCGRSTYLHEHR